MTMGVEGRGDCRRGDPGEGEEEVAVSAGHGRGAPPPSKGKEEQPKVGVPLHRERGHWQKEVNASWPLLCIRRKRNYTIGLSMRNAHKHMGTAPSSINQRASKTRQGKPLRDVWLAV